jgi:DNA-binding transcriptional regulator YiaG
MNTPFKEIILPYCMHVKKKFAHYEQKFSRKLLTSAHIGLILIARRPKTSKGGEAVALPNIEVERIRHGLSRTALAEMLGVSLRTVRNWQSGKTEVPLSKLMLMSRVWGVSIDYLISPVIT